MFSKLGIVTILGGAGVWLFSMISLFMDPNNLFGDITLSSISENTAQTIVDAFSSEGIQDLLYTLFYEVHLGLVLLGLGIIFLVISLFVKEH